MLLHWQELISTSSVLGLLIVAWWILDKWIPPLSSILGKLTFGAMLGLTAVLGMAMSHDVLPGFKFDLRHAIIAASGLFGGPVSAAVSALAAGIYRLVQGGAGAVPGAIGICITATIGCLGYYLIPVARRNFLSASAFAACVTLGVFASFFAISDEIRYTLLREVGLPVFTLTFATTVATVLLFNMDFARRDAIRLNEIYAAMVKELPDCLCAKDLDGRFIAANEATAQLMRATSADELVGRTDFDYYPEELARQYRDDELAVLRSGEPKLMEQPVNFNTGESGWLSTAKVPMKNSRGEIIGLISHNRDITELRTLMKGKPLPDRLRSRLEPVIG